MTVPSALAPAEPELPVELGALSGLIGYALRRAQLAVAQDFHHRVSAEGIRPGQYSVLTVLQNNPGLRAARAAEALGIKRTNFVPVLDGLEARGLAERRRVKGDRRASALFLTEAGEAVLTRLAPLVAEHEARFAGRLGTDGRCQLMGLLHRLGEAGFDAV